MKDELDENQIYSDIEGNDKEDGNAKDTKKVV